MLANFRRITLLILVLMATLLPLTTAMAENTTHDGRDIILFTQQDEVQEFLLNTGTLTGTGFQTGTAIGKISGTSFVDWTFQALSLPDAEGKATISFTNTVIITDLDGDQITFKHVGTGLFHFGFPNATFKGTGGTLAGTYLVTGGTGKYAHWVRNRYDYRGVATNPPRITAAGQPALGTAYAEIYSSKSKD